MSWDRALLDRGYAHSSRRLYRQVLRGIAAWLKSHNRAAEPSVLTGADVFAYIAQMANRRGSWSWLAMNICVMRTLFDEFGGRQITMGLLTPRRNWSLPEVLSEDEVARLLTAGGTLRDQLLLGLLYGCGLKPGEVEKLRWSVIAEDASTLRVTNSRQTPAFLSMRISLRRRNAETDTAFHLPPPTLHHPPLAKSPSPPACVPYWQMAAANAHPNRRFSSAAVPANR